MSASDELKRAKRRLRSEVRQLRDALSERERRERGVEIERRLFSEVPGVPEARTAMCFASIGSEVPTEGIIARLHALGCVVALPRVVAREMAAVTHRPGDPVTVGPLGIAEPVDGGIVPASEIDLVVVPGLAFDREGFRVGYGAGFFDRFLRDTGTAAIIVGICFALQVVPAVPHGRGDRPVEWVVTEDESIRCRRGPEA